MNSPDTTTDKICFLSRADSRVRIMEHLSDSSPVTKRELRDQLSMSRSTISRAVDSLAGVGWLTDESTAVRLTPVGELVITEYLSLAETIETAEELSPFLDWFPLSEFDITVAELREGEITAVSDGDPLAPARKQTDIVQTSSQFTGLFPSLDFSGSEVVHEQTVDGEFDSEMVVSAAVADTIRSERFAPLYREMLETGRLTVHVVDDVPFYVGMADDGRTQIGVEDDEGFPQALLETSNEAVRAWAEQLVADYCAASTHRLTDPAEL